MPRDSHLVEVLLMFQCMGVLAWCNCEGCFCCGEKQVLRTLLTGIIAGLAEELLQGILPAWHFELGNWGMDILVVVSGMAVSCLSSDRCNIDVAAKQKHATA